MTKPAAQLVGQTFGRLTVRGRVANVRGYTTWACECTCGQWAVVRGVNLVHSRTMSCGCLNREATKKAQETHGMSKTPIYKLWASMHRRCKDTTRPDYHRYGGRGITVCERWALFTNFYADMGPRPHGMTLDRRDNDKCYSPENCRWATYKEQRLNQGQNIQVMLNGKTLPLAEACTILRLKRHNVYMRMRRGNTFQEAIQ